MTRRLIPFTDSSLNILRFRWQITGYQEETWDAHSSTIFAKLSHCAHSPSGVLTPMWEQPKGMSSLFSLENKFFCTGEIRQKIEKQQFGTISSQVLQLITLKINISYFPFKYPNHNSSYNYQRDRYSNCTMCNNSDLSGRLRGHDHWLFDGWAFFCCSVFGFSPN